MAVALPFGREQAVRNYNAEQIVRAASSETVDETAATVDDSLNTDSAAESIDAAEQAGVQYSHFVEDEDTLGVPSNVVTPALLEALEDAGVKIEYTEEAPKKAAPKGSVQLQTWDEAEKEFGIRSLNDYIGVQKDVVRTLDDRGFFDGVQNIVKMENADMTVEITRDGIRETLGPGDRFQYQPREVKQAKIATINQLPEIIRTGTLTLDNAPNEKNPKSDIQYAYLTSEAVYDGKPCTVKVTIRKSRQKNKFWLHAVEVETQKESDLSTSGPEAEQAYNKAQTPAPNIADTEQESKAKLQMWDNSPVEDVNSKLVAVHNVSEEKLLGALKLGGLPMPSIAIVKSGTVTPAKTMTVRIRHNAAVVCVRRHLPAAVYPRRTGPVDIHVHAAHAPVCENDLAATGDLISPATFKACALHARNIVTLSRDNCDKRGFGIHRACAVAETAVDSAPIERFGDVLEGQVL